MLRPPLTCHSRLQIIHRDYDNVLLKGCVPAWENATVHPDAAKRGVQPRMKKVWPPCYPTAGNFVVIVIGEGEFALPHAPAAAVATQPAAFVAR